MCYLYRVAKMPHEVFGELGLVDEISEQTNQRLLFPMYQAPLVRGDGGRLIVDERQWGWLPAKWKPSARYPKRKKYQRERVNARCETIDTTWGFRQEFARGQRCVLLADAFHEPFKGTDGNWFSCDPPMVGIAGLWARHDGEELVESCTMLTTDANQFVAGHRTGQLRMPVVLDEVTARQWLDPDRREPAHFADVFRPFDPGQMTMIEPPPLD